MSNSIQPFLVFVCVQLCEEKKTLEDRAQRLEQNLKEAVQGQLAPARYKIDADTPVEKIVRLLSSIIEVRLAQLQTPHI